MAFPACRRQSARDVIAFLRTKADSPCPCLRPRPRRRLNPHRRREQPGGGPPAAPAAPKAEATAGAGSPEGRESQRGARAGRLRLKSRPMRLQSRRPRKAPAPEAPEAEEPAAAPAPAPEEPKAEAPGRSLQLRPAEDAGSRRGAPAASPAPDADISSSRRPQANRSQPIPTASRNSLTLQLPSPPQAGEGRINMSDNSWRAERASMLRGPGIPRHRP